MTCSHRYWVVEWRLIERNVLLKCQNCGVPMLVKDMDAHDGFYMTKAEIDAALNETETAREHTDERI